MADVLIVRDSCDKSTLGTRVYVVGPLWGVAPLLGSYSSTAERAKASRFSRDDAERLINAGKWRRLHPELEEA